MKEIMDLLPRDIFGQIAVVVNGLMFSKARIICGDDAPALAPAQICFYISLAKLARTTETT